MIRTQAQLVGVLVVFLASSAGAQHVLATFDGSQASGNLGSALTAAGDIDGDGHLDFVARAANLLGGGTDAAVIHVFLGPIVPPLLVPSASIASPVANASFGQSLAAADVDGDGYTDLLAGGPDASLTTTQHGQAYLFLGSPAGFSLVPAWTTQSFQTQAFLGASLAIAGDVDGDGFPDAVIDAPLTDIGTTINAGRLRLFRGGAAGLERDPAWVLDGTVADEGDSRLVYGAGDVDADGFADFAIGRSIAIGGTVQVFRGAAALPAFAPSTVLVSQFTETDAFGLPIAAGDWNGDAYSDLLVGARLTNSLFGRAYSFHGSAGGVSTAPATILDGPIDNGLFGFATADAGDLNGDGFSDALIGAVMGASSIPTAGAAELHHGSPAGLVTTTAWSEEGTVGDTYFGRTLAGVGDVDEDGVGDFIVGGQNFDAPPLVNAGRVYLYGKRCDQTPSAVTFGAGKPGSAGVPTLTASAPPAIGSAITLTLANGLPGASPILFLGVAPMVAAFDGGALLVQPLFLIPLPPLDPSGSLALPAPVPSDPLFCSAVSYLQAMFVDPAAAGPYHTAQTPALFLSLGD